MRPLHLFTAFALALALAPPQRAAAATWEIDPSHTTASFKVRHMMVTWVRGEFARVSGKVEYEATRVAEARADITLDASTIDTREQKRDDHLRSPDFLDAAKFPTLTFRSKAVRAVQDGTFELVGDLTIRGVTREVVLKVEGPSKEYKDPWGNTKVGASATTVINRHDFGASWNKAIEMGGVLVGDEVHITIEVELKRVG